MTNSDRARARTASQLASAMASRALVVDADGRLLAWNAAAADRFGLADGDLGRAAADTGAGPHLAAATRIALAPEAVESGVLLAWPEAADGDPGALDGDPDAALAAMAASSVDPATDLALHRAELLARLAPNVSHDFVNVVSSLKGVVTIARTEPAVMANLGEELVGEAAKAVDRGHALVLAYLEVARERAPLVVPVRLASAVAGAMQLVEHDIVSSVEVDVDVPRRLPAVEADEPRLHLAILSALVSAVEALGGKKASGRLTVRAAVSNEDGPVQLRITDSAPAVPPEDRAHLFDAVPPPDASRRAGRLLRVARELLRGFGGDLRYEAAGDHGNTLLLLLPSLESGPVEPGDEPEPLPERPTAEGRPLVLVCDDDPLIRSLLIRMLDRIAVTCVPAASGPEALELLDDRAFDAAVVDIRMKGMTGAALYLAAVEAHPDLEGRFVLMTGNVEDDELVRFAADHGLPLLAKPFTHQEIEAVLRAITEA